MLLLSTMCLILFVTTEAQAIVPYENPFTISGRVTDQDGSPASNATVTVVANWPNMPVEPPVSVRCDEDGEFRALTSRFGFSNTIHAVSEDGGMHCEMLVSDFMARTEAAKPILMQLKLAHDLKVKVTSEGRPVSDCRIVIEPLPASRQTTDSRGEATLRIPVNTAARRITAFHAKLGIGAWSRNNVPDSLPDRIEISIEKPAPHTFRVLDQHGDPVPNFAFTAAVRVNESWASTALISAAQIRTGDEGTADVPWMPASYQSIDPVPASQRWLIDERSSNGNTTVVRARQKHVFLGRVRFSDGKARSGVLLVATSSGPGSSGDHAQTRTDKQGKFRLWLAPDHVYVLGVSDLEWASDLRTGVFLRTNGDSINVSKRGFFLNASPAVPVTVNVVDTDGKPMDFVWVNFGPIRNTDWIDIDGRERHSSHRILHWLRTGRSGAGTFGVTPGKLHITATKEGWRQSQDVTVKADVPLTVTIKRKPEPAE